MKFKFAILITLLCCANVFAGSRKFIKLQQLESLSNSTVFSTYQDRLGAIWLSTNYGLYRYNGNSLEYMKEPLPMKPIRGNQGNYIYVTAYDAIYQFDIRDYSSIKLFHTDIDYSSCVFLAENDSLWITSHSDVYLYSDGIISLQYSLPHSETQISSIAITNKKELLLGTTQDGVYKIDAQGTISQIATDIKDISTLLFDSEENIWIGTSGHGVYCVKADRREIVQLSTKSSSTQRLFNDYVRDICEDQYKNIWIGTLGGISIVDDKSTDNKLYNVLNESSIWSLTPDNQGGCMDWYIL